MNMQDFRGQGPPGDIGIFQSPCSIFVYQYTFSGIMHICAARQGDRGWVLVDHGIDATTVINNAFDALPAHGGLIIIRGESDFITNNSIGPSKSYSYICGMGAEATRIKQIAGGNQTLYRNRAGAPITFCGVSDMSFDGTRATATAGKGLDLTDMSQVFLENLLVQACKEQGIYSNSGIAANGNGVWGHRIRSWGNLGHQLHLAAGSANWKFTDSEFAGYGGVLGDTGYGIRLDSANECFFGRCAVDGIWGAIGVMFNQTGQCEFSKGYVGASQLQAFSLYDAVNSIVIGNSFVGNNQAHQNFYTDLGIQNTAHHNTVADNVFAETLFDLPNSCILSIQDAGVDYNNVHDNTFNSPGATQLMRNLGGANNVFHNNPGYNPQGNIATPYSVAAGNLGDVAGAQAFPTSAVNYTVTSSPKLVTIYGGTITSVSIDGVATGQTGAATFAAYRLEPGQVLNVVWAVQPSSVVYAC